MSRLRNKLVTLSGGNREVTEQYRSLRAQLEQGWDAGPRIVAAVAPREGNGTAETAANLAVAYAQAGRRTLLVDGDMSKPSVHALFGLPNELGLSTILERACEPGEAVHGDIIANLSVMTAGPSPLYSGDPLGSYSLRQMFDQWRSDNDIVWLSAPPLLSSSDAQLLVAACDGTLLVMQSGVVDESDAFRVKRMLALLEVRTLGVALTHRRRRSWLKF